MKIIIAWLALLLFGSPCFLVAQGDLPSDYLSPEFHAGRREAFRAMMPEHSVALIFSYSTRTFSQDVDYVYHPNPDLYYLTGYKEPNAVLVLFKDDQHDKGSSYHEIFFVQKRDSSEEQWTGRRLGVAGVQSTLGIKNVFEGKTFKSFPIDFSAQQKILFSPFPSDVKDERDTAGLFDLVQQFKVKAGFPADYDPELASMQTNVVVYSKYFKDMQGYLKEAMATNEKYKNVAWINEMINVKDSTEQVRFLDKLKKIRYDNYDFARILNKLRGIKTDDEMKLLRKAVQISSIAHKVAMQTMNPDMSEREIQGVQEFVHKKYGAEEVGYGSIVGAGPNGCILHYENNDRLHVGNQLVLMDVAAEYHGYSADVTRTAPANGKFSPEQKTIYDIVYEAQEDIFKICRPGIPTDSLQQTARAHIAKALIKLGIITKTNEVDTYYPHGCSHHLGLDVHDRGDYDTLTKGMVITVEPGIYIREGSACDKKWWGIGVRIEDDILITNTGYELLSYLAPRKSEDVEKVMTNKSALHGFEVPVLPGSK